MSEPSFTPSSRGAFSYHWNQSINNHDSCTIRLLHSIKGLVIAFFTTYTISEHEINTTYLNKEKDSLSDHSNSFFYKEYLKRKSIKATITNENKPTSNINNKRPLQAKEDAMMKELSGIKKNEISVDEFIKIMINNNFKDSVHYIVTGEMNLTFSGLSRKGIDCENIHLPKYLTVNGDINISFQHAVHSFPDIFIVTGSLNAFLCHGIKDLSKTKLKVEESVSFSHCSNMEYAPNQIFVGNDINFSGCSSMIKLPDHLSLSGSIRMNHCDPKIIHYFYGNQNTLYPGIKISTV